MLDAGTKWQLLTKGSSDILNRDSSKMVNAIRKNQKLTACCPGVTKQPSTRKPRPFTQKFAAI